MMKSLLTSVIILLHFSAAAQFLSEEKILSTPGGDLKGTLILPLKAKKNLTVVVIQAGSGPTNRYGNNPMGVKANSYKLIAESLAQRNIATLLMDKRGIAQSAAAMKNEAALRFDDYADDLAGWISFIKKDKRVKKVFIAGHSEGSLVGMIAAQKEKVNGYISLEGAGERIDRIIVWQYAQQLPKDAPVIDSLFNRLINDQKIDTVPPFLMSILRPSVQPYMASWIKHDPCIEISKLKMPVLIIQGGTDLQTVTAQGETLKKCAPGATYLFIPAMNHVLKDAEADRTKNFATYANADLPLSAGLIDAITNFVKK
jgi:pimeloyl-ACP methyl ester carboxylesterase